MWLYNTAEDSPEYAWRGGGSYLIEVWFKRRKKNILFTLGFVKPFSFMKSLMFKPKLSRQWSFKSLSSSTFHHPVLSGKVQFVILSPSKVLDRLFLENIYICEIFFFVKDFYRSFLRLQYVFTHFPEILLPFSINIISLGSVSVEKFSLSCLAVLKEEDLLI